MEIAIEPYVAVVPLHHRLAGNDEVRLGELREEKWIRDDVVESPCSAIAASAWHEAGFTPETVIQAADHHSAIAFVRAGLGICIMPRLAAHAAGNMVRTPAVIAPTPQRRIVIHRHESVAKDVVTISLIDKLSAALLHTNKPASGTAARSGDACG